MAKIKKRNLDDICFPVPQNLSITTPSNAPATIESNEAVKKYIFQQTIQTACQISIPYDYDAVEKLQEHRSKNYIGLLKKWHQTKEQKNEKAKHKAFESMQIHQKQNEILKRETCKSGYYWY